MFGESCGGQCMNARTELVFIYGNLTADRYINKCLANHVVPFGPYIGNGCLLMHDNAHPHAARVTTNYLRTHTPLALPQIICKKWRFACCHDQQGVLIQLSTCATCWDGVLGGGRDHRKTYGS
ncbi:hypothetical protein QE152_g5838 [Popillia japonica]|uniref:Transposase n=1 Tax=Popillia japonica TaxID=7064 RepID=A0AAW1ML51_POPJA